MYFIPTEGEIKTKKYNKNSEKNESCALALSKESFCFLFSGLFFTRSTDLVERILVHRNHKAARKQKNLSAARFQYLGSLGADTYFRVS
jgi:hypothetical protein